MAHRFTMKECEELSDYDMLYLIANDRWGSLTNVYSPLSQRLSKLLKKLADKQELSK
jgi:hypothetical protein